MHSEGAVNVIISAVVVVHYLSDVIEYLKLRPGRVGVLIRILSGGMKQARLVAYSKRLHTRLITACHCDALIAPVGKEWRRPLDWIGCGLVY